MESLNSLKERAIAEVDRRREEFINLSIMIHSHPEQGLREFQAVKWLTDYLDANGFKVKKGIAGLETSFRASYGSGRPAVAFLAEYDALPEIGHACGHNIIASSSVGAAIALKSVAGVLKGTIEVIGTPAEEAYGGKAVMVEKGVFDKLDAVMLVHPDNENYLSALALACQSLEIEYFGKAAHAAAHPERGLNALEALIQAFNNINSLRQHIPESCRIHGVITDGGKAPNVVPDHSAAHFLVRALEDDCLDELKDRVLNCFIAASIATGTRLNYRWGVVRYETMRNNLPLSELFAANIKRLGREPLPFDRKAGMGSTDMGNVSHKVAAIHPSIAIASPEVQVHTPEFTIAAISEKGNNGMLDAAKAMAMTGIDIIYDSESLDRIKKAFEGSS